MAKNRGKKYQDALKKVDSKKEYAVDAATWSRKSTSQTLTQPLKLHLT